MIAGRRTQLLIDSGASLTLINLHFFLQLSKYYRKKVRLPPSNLCLQLADRSQLYVKYALSLPITISNSTRMHRVYVVPKLWRSCIIGNDLIHKHNLQIDGGRQYAYFKTKKNKKLQHRVNLVPDAQAHNSPPFRYAPARKQIIEENLKDMLDHGIISPSASPWASPVILAPKKDGTLRFCVDYRKLNSLQEAKFWQWCLVYINDVIIFSPTFEQHIIDLEKGFQALQSVNLTLKASKYQFCRREMRYLEYIITQNGIKPDPDLIKPITNSPQPRKIKDVQSFLGLTGYYRRFIKDYSKISEPLQQQLRNSQKCNHHLNWSRGCTDAFEILKNVETSDFIRELCVLQKVHGTYESF
ncbi:unnamed protein product [Rotaria magnacalcarata]